MKPIRIIAILTMISLVVVVADCGKDNDSTGPDTSIPAGLIATWTYLTINGLPVQNFRLFLGWQEETVSARFTVGGDGTFVNRELDSDDMVIWTENGTFTVSGNQATITITSDSDGPVDPPDIMSGTWALNGNELTLTTTMLGQPLVIVATK